MLKFWLLAIFIKATAGHPQCLDFLPPFNPDGDFQLCSEYRTFGCCTDDLKIQLEYNRLISNLSDAERTRCGAYLRDILCQVCSPYAAHLYNAEGSGNPNTFPSLCTDHLMGFLKQCSGLLNKLPVSLPLPAPDRTYCYPNVLHNMNFTENLGNIGVANDGTCLQLCVKEVVNDIHTPTAATHAKDNTHRFFVGEQKGVIWAYLSNFTKLSPPFLDLRRDVFSSARKYDERGLLDLEFHPNHASNGLFYVLYSFRASSGHVSRVSEFKVSSDMNFANRSSERVILDIPQPAANHNGGKLLFREGNLYIFTGDGGKAGDPFGNGQNKATLLGKALRVNVSASTPGQSYGIPVDNPFIFETGAKPEVYSYGLRNPWRCSVDRGDRTTGAGSGRIFCGDVGQESYEEVDIIERGGNFGWNAFEGNFCYKKTLCGNIRNHVPPIGVYGHDEGKSITGGFVYRGCESPNLNGLYIFADWWNGQLFYLKESNGSWTKGKICMGGDDICVNGGLGNQYARYITSFAEDESGELYMMSTSNPSQKSLGGHVYKLVDPSRRGNPLDCYQTPPRDVSISSQTTLRPFVATTDATIAIRLVGEYSNEKQGRVEVRRGNGPWGTVCDDFWDRREANVVCKQLGFSQASSALPRAFFGRGTGKIFLDNLRCSGSENTLYNCNHRGWGVHDCTHAEDASVICI